MTIKYFRAILDKNKGSGYGLTFPDIPGCHAGSDTFAGIIRAGNEALSLHPEAATITPSAHLTELSEPRPWDGDELEVMIPFHPSMLEKTTKAPLNADNEIIADFRRDDILRLTLLSVRKRAAKKLLNACVAIYIEDLQATDTWSAHALDAFCKNPGTPLRPMLARNIRYRAEESGDVHVGTAPLKRIQRAILAWVRRRAAPP